MFAAPVSRSWKTMKNVSGCAIVNVLPYVFSRDDEPLNSIAGRPFTALRRNVAAADPSNEVRSRAKPLRSVHLVTAAPSAYDSWPASNHIWRPLVTGGGSAAVTGGATAAVCADTAVAEPAVFDAVTAARIVAPTSPATSV